MGLWMQCPKCGREYEGSTCPWCTGPEILVNSDDYIKRRKAYEEKQAAKESASSNRAAETAEKRPDEVLKSLANEGRRRIKERAQKSSNSDEGKKQDGRKKTSTCRKALLCLLLVAAAAAAFGIYKLSQRKNYVLYMSYNDRIYNVAGLESQLVCEISDAVFEADNDTFYMPHFPENIKTSTVIQQMASAGGKYFCSVTYDSEASAYTVYLWNNRGYIRISEDEKEKEIKYVSEEGSVVYTAADVVNTEGAVGGVELMAYEAEKGSSVFEEGVLTLVDSDFKSMTVYEDKDTLVILDNEGNLYTYCYGKERVRKLVARDVDRVYVMSEDAADVYVEGSQDIVRHDDADGFIYSAAGSSYYHELSGKHGEDVALGQSGSAVTAYIYQENEDVYRISSGTAEYAKIQKNGVPQYKTAGFIGTFDDWSYIPSEKLLLLVNGEGELSGVEQGKPKTVAVGVESGSLSVVENTRAAITYVRDGVRYYRESISASEVVMAGEGSASVSDGAIYYKNRLYFYNADKKLYSCTVKGKDLNQVGEVNRVWLGTEYK